VFLFGHVRTRAEFDGIKWLIARYP
jgi:hypothetical protein